ncbi:alpha/beta fold hydrolase [Kibdelosporangium philippinense]|uniref:Alpha/beta fold hydrolase n=1 Tax=Kibdelosporangium philippinense TaxID=211113 RepID=A0ABS8ZB35_9PSEU|nr:alpha/beta fold hydrolase [Kibdelosporangium philippinense]MCE7003896.1 alpha/beta fold hydrolase [Kibdelosporangium philippinense]
MNYLKSQDSTQIAYTTRGSGPAVVLVGGGLDDGTENAPLAEALAQWFTVLNYARRGRGDSGDTLPYFLSREVEDLAAVMSVVDGPAHVFGASSGGALALEAAASGLPIASLAVYEVPYMADENMVNVWSHYVDQLIAALSAGRRGEAVELFMGLAGSSPEDIAGARESPFWPGLEALAPTLAYDAACIGDGPVPASRLASVTQPVLVATGGVPDPHMGGLQPGFFDAAAEVLAAALPVAERQVIANQTHVADPSVLGPVLHKFFTAM